MGPAANDARFRTVALTVTVLLVALLFVLEASAAIAGYTRGRMSEAKVNAEVVFYEIGFVLLIPIAIGVEVIRRYARPGRLNRAKGTGS
jgi:hypothetical protein